MRSKDFAKSLIWLYTFVSIAATLTEANRGHSPKQAWETYKLKYKKKYSPSEDSRRMEIYNENVKIIEDHNMKYADGHSKYKLAVNHLTDYRPMEKAVAMMHSKENIEFHKTITLATFHQSNPTPARKDWREENVISPVKKQGECGSCWAFTSTGVLESHYTIKTGRKQLLSEQYLVDCTEEKGNLGCDGGVVVYALKYVIENGIATEDSYPYQEAEEACKKDATIFNDLKVIAYRRTESGMEDQLKHAVGTIGPVTVAIDTNHTSFTFYSDGIHYQPNCRENSPTHAALVVGYGSEDGEDYWIVKNSWGSTWGENGYIRMARNKNNNCGIASNAVYPLIQTTKNFTGRRNGASNHLTLPVHLLFFIALMVHYWNR